MIAPIKTTKISKIQIQIITKMIIMNITVMMKIMKI